MESTGSGRRVAWPFQSMDAPRLQACLQSQAGFAAPPLVRTMWAQHSQGAVDPELSAQAEAEGKSCCWVPVRGLGGDSGSGTGWHSPGVVVRRGWKPPIESRVPSCKMTGVRQLQLRWNGT